VTSHEKQIVEKGFEQDRLDYWAMRDELLAKYAGKWVAVHKGSVVAVGDEPLAIMDQALASDGYAYTNKVGEEDKIVIRQRIGINSMKCPRRRILRDLSRKKRVGRRREHETRQQRWPRGEISLSFPLLHSLAASNL
jgi:hypothetical protein